MKLTPRHPLDIMVGWLLPSLSALASAQAPDPAGPGEAGPAWTEAPQSPWGTTLSGSLNQGADNVYAAHRSHSSHSSHSSGSSGGGSYYRSPSYTAPSHSSHSSHYSGTSGSGSYSRTPSTATPSPAPAYRYDSSGSGGNSGGTTRPSTPADSTPGPAYTVPTLKAPRLDASPDTSRLDSSGRDRASSVPETPRYGRTGDDPVADEKLGLDPQSQQFKNLIVRAQVALYHAGFGSAKFDGILGPGTRKALTDFQTSKGIEATGRLTTETLDALGIKI
jgi:His-Xaa-Ser repeat protein HxsA